MPTVDMEKVKRAAEDTTVGNVSVLNKAETEAAILETLDIDYDPEDIAESDRTSTATLRNILSVVGEDEQ